MEEGSNSCIGPLSAEKNYCVPWIAGRADPRIGVDLADKTKSPAHTGLQTPERTALNLNIIPNVLFRLPLTPDRHMSIQKISITMVRKPVLYKIKDCQ